MSIKVTTDVWDHSTTKGTDLLVLLALADISDEKGECWPSIAYIARKSRLDPRNARKRIRSLQARGELAVIEHGGKSSSRGGLRSNRYRITVHLPPDTDASAPIEDHDTDASAPQTLTPASAPILTPASADTSLLHVTDSSERKTKKRKAQISETFTVSDEMREWCITNGIRSNPTTETRKFINHHRSKENVFADPVSAWRKWMFQADEYAGNSSQGDGRSKNLRTIDATLNAITPTGALT